MLCPSCTEKQFRKWAYHMVRMVLDADRISQGAGPQVMKTGEERELLMSIRRGEWSPEDVASFFLEREGAIDARKPWGIPKHANAEELDDLLYSIRMGSKLDI